MPSRFHVAAFLLLLGACATDDPASTDGEPIEGHSCVGTDARLGTGVRSFEPVADGDTVYLYRGPQGGYMIYLGIQARGIDPADVSVCYTETFVDSAERFGEGCWRVRLTNDLGSGWYERVGIWGEVDESFWTRPKVIRGRDVRVDTVVTDAHGCQLARGYRAHVHEEQGM